MPSPVMIHYCVLHCTDNAKYRIKSYLC